MKLLKTIVNSAICSVHHVESRGGVYLIDFESNNFEQVIDWHDFSIDWKRKELVCGLWRIACYKVLAASDEIYACNCGFYWVESYKSKYLKHCHDIYFWRRLLPSMHMFGTGAEALKTIYLNIRNAQHLAIWASD